MVIADHSITKRLAILDLKLFALCTCNERKMQNVFTQTSFTQKQIAMVTRKKVCDQLIDLYLVSNSQHLDKYVNRNHLPIWKNARTVAI